MIDLGMKKQVKQAGGYPQQGTEIHHSLPFVSNFQFNPVRILFEDYINHSLRNHNNFYNLLTRSPFFDRFQL
jgi:hypothetical protein